MLVSKSSTSSQENVACEPYTPMRLCRYRDPNRHLRSGVRSGGSVGDNRVPSANAIASQLWRRRRRVHRRRDGWTDADYRARRTFCLGILSLLASSVASTDFECEQRGDGSLECGRLYPHASKPAMICSVLPNSIPIFSGSWMIFESTEGSSFKMLEVATFVGNSITFKRSGFLGSSDGQTYSSELWPPAKYTGPISCTVGDFSKTICVLPSPSLFWSFRETGVVTVERMPVEEQPFGDSYCRNLGVDSEHSRYTRTFWAINSRGVVAISEEQSGQGGGR